MRATRTICIAIFILAFAAGCQTQNSTTVSSGAQTMPSDYVLALSAADEFMGAWQMRDQHRGVSLCTKALRASMPEEDLLNTICGPSNPHHEAFELVGWKKLAADRFRFEFAYYCHYTGENKTEPRYTCVLEVTPAADERWAVDRISGL